MSNIIAFFLFALSLSCVAADLKPAGTFMGLKKGFFNTKGSSAPKSTPHAVKDEHDISKAVAMFTSWEDEAATTPSKLWGNPAFKTAAMRREIYTMIGASISDDWVAQMERNFELLAQGAHKVPCESLEFVKSVLRLWVLFNNASDNLRTVFRPLKPDIQSFIIQNLINWVLQAKFAYMASLKYHEAEPFRNNFITKDSDDAHGELILTGTGWDVTGGRPPARIRYVRESIKNGGTLYRLVAQSQTNRPWVAISGDDSLSCYSKGEIIYGEKVESPAGDNYLSLISSGLILDNGMRLVEQEGLVLIKGWLFPEDLHIFSYAKHPFFDEMFFFEQELIEPTTISPMAEALIQSIGGIDQLHEKKFIFIPKRHDHISAIEARFLLPLLQGFKDTMNAEPTPSPLLEITWIDEGISTLKNIIVDDMVAQKDEVQEHAIIQDVVDHEIAEELKNTTSSLVQDIEKKRKEIRHLQNTNSAERDKYFKREKKKLIKKAKQNKVTQLDPEIIKARKREKALVHVEEKYIKQASLKRNFSASDVHELLGNMVDDLAPLGIEKTGQAHARGSHAAVEIIDKSSGNATYVSLAARPQKSGYQAGTLKAIVRDMMHKVNSLGRKNKPKD
jgi:hypothetical protein